MALMLVSQGLGNATAVAATLICRLCTLWLAVLIGFAAMLGLRLRPARDHLKIDVGRQEGR